MESQLKLHLKDHLVYYDLEESAERNFEQVPSTRSPSIESTINLGITSNNQSELASVQNIGHYNYVPPPAGSPGNGIADKET